MYYAKDGKPISLMEWAKLFEDRDYKQCFLDYVGPLRISTVWLGLDHGYGLSDQPLIFETMVFNDEKRHESTLLPGRSFPEVEDEGERYPTIYAAEEGHKRYVKKWEAKCGTSKSASSSTKPSNPDSQD